MVLRNRSENLGSRLGSIDELYLLFFSEVMGICAFLVPLENENIFDFN